MELYEQKWKQYLLTEAQQNVLLFVDDNRDPNNPAVLKYIKSRVSPEVLDVGRIVWVKSNEEMRSWINSNGTPKAVSFDVMRKSKGQSDGLEAFKYFLNYLEQDNIVYPSDRIGFHTGSPEMEAELQKLLSAYNSNLDVEPAQVEPETKPTTPTSTEPAPISSEPGAPEEEPETLPVDQPETDIDEPETEEPDAEDIEDGEQEDV